MFSKEVSPEVDKLNILNQTVIHSKLAIHEKMNIFEKLVVSTLMLIKQNDAVLILLKKILNMTNVKEPNFMNRTK